MEDFTWVKQLILLSRSVLDQIGCEITMKSLILLCSQNFTFKRATFQFDSNIFWEFLNYCKFRNNLEEVIEFCLVPGQKWPQFGIFIVIHVRTVTGFVVL
jgi:hypothetical protein